MNYSVVIRNKNEEKYIGYAIQSVVDFLGDKIQLVIVDNESSDESIRIVQTFDYLNISWLNIEHNDYSPGKSLNMGIQECTEDYTMILSAHCDIKKFDSDRVVNKLNEEDFVAVWGKQIPIWDGKKIYRRYMWSNFKDEDLVNYFCESEDRYFFHNAFSMFRTDYVKENPFDEILCGKEDRFWAIDQIQDGKKIFYDSTIEVHHHYTTNGATWKGVG